MGVDSRAEGRSDASSARKPSPEAGRDNPRRIYLELRVFVLWIDGILRCQAQVKMSQKKGNISGKK